MGENFGMHTPGQSLQRTSDGTSVFSTDTPTPGLTNVCFAHGTYLATPVGDRRVENLQAGDLVLTADHCAQEIRWIFCKVWMPEQVAACPPLAPVLICQDALGIGMPTQQLRLSQQHRVPVQGPIARRMFGADQVLIPAKALLPLAGVMLEQPCDPVGYFHVMLAQHEIIFSNALPIESLFLGKQALYSIPQDALN